MQLLFESGVGGGWPYSQQPVGSAARAPSTPSSSARSAEAPPSREHPIPNTWRRNAPRHA
eukprot:932252-Pleurochrysis_carterae.AAC.1